MKLFEDLEWGPAFKRAAFLVAFWLLALYVLNVAFPETFILGLDTAAGVVSMLVNAVLFFFFFAVLPALPRGARGAAPPRSEPREKAGLVPGPPLDRRTNPAHRKMEKRRSGRSQRSPQPEHQPQEGGAAAAALKPGRNRSRSRPGRRRVELHKKGAVGDNVVCWMAA